MATTTKKPAKVSTEPAPEELILEAITALKANPDKYQALRAAMGKAKTEKAKAKVLVKYATNERQLAALVPARVKGKALAATWTTVTVTTVFILEDSAY